MTNNLDFDSCYSPVGVTPAANIQANQLSPSMISSITNLGRVRFRIYNGAINGEVFNMFLARLFKDAKRKIFLVVDNHCVHHAEMLLKWLEMNQNHIELLFLPSCSPERNPDKYLNNDLKTIFVSRKHPRTSKELLGNILLPMQILQKLPEHVSNFFQHLSAKYVS